MSVVVKGVDFPKTCGECEFNYNCFCCQITNRRFYDNEEFEPFIQKLDDCPLIELPKHGRLIDADALKNDLLYDVAKDTEYLWTSLSDNERENIQLDKDCKQNCASYVSDAPTVLEADE